MTRPAKGPESRRYDRYRNAGVDITTQPEKVDEPEPKKQTKAEAQRAQDQREAEAERQRQKDYEGLNRGLPTHRGADEKTYQATIKGLHGRDYTDAEVVENERARWYQEGNTGTPITHEGFSKEDQKRLKDAARKEREVE